MKINELAYLGAEPEFNTPRSTSNLIQPRKSIFLSYIKNDFNNGCFYDNGFAVKRLEQRLAELHGTKHCVAVCNGLWGLVIAIHCLKKEGKTEIVMPSLTYRRMADIAAWLGLTPHFCDIDEDTLGISSKTAAGCINENTAILLALHPIVNLCDIDGMVSLAKKHNLPILFDSVEASYADWNGKCIGSFGDAECFSVHASKFLNGFEGGYITTNNSELKNKLKILRNNGINDNNKVISLGISGKLNDMHAAMTLACLDGLKNQLESNRAKFKLYQKLISDIEGLELIEYSDKEKRSYKNILVKLNDKWHLSRSLTIDILQKENMLVRSYYYPPLHLKKSEYKTITGDMTKTNVLMDLLMLLPCGELVDENDIYRIVSYLKFLQENSSEVINYISSH